MLTELVLPACLTPVADPSAEKRLVPKIPAMSGSFCSAAVTSLAAVAGSSWLYCTPRYLNFASAFAAASNPATRASVVEIPGSTEITSTFPPFGFSFLMASNAALPPPLLSEEICDTANDRLEEHTSELQSRHYL